MKILVVADYFLPGHLAGGPIRTLKNMRDLTTDDVRMDIFTRDRDQGMPHSYNNRKSNDWYKDKKGKIFYAGKFRFSPFGLSSILKKEHYDLIYINSFFSLFGSILLVLYLKVWYRGAKILLAPRGEFSKGALTLKRKKKMTFIAIAKIAGLYKNIKWHASTDMEKLDIQSCFPNSVENIFVAPDPVVINANSANEVRSTKAPGALSAVFISRISPMKNLDGLLLLLEKVESSVTLNVYGPLEDKEYWDKCATIISTLPKNVNVVCHGPLPPELVSSVFAEHHVFLFPTHGENFGHVIFESLRAGTPVILSDNTPWQEDEARAIETYAISDIHGWLEALERYASYDQHTMNMKRVAAKAYAKKYVDDSDPKKHTIALFEWATE